MHIIKGCHRDRGRPLFSTACNHSFGVSTANRFPCLTYAIAACRTRSNGSPIWSLGPDKDRDKPWSTVDNDHVGKMWADAFRPFLKKHLKLLVNRCKSTNATSNVDTHIISILVGNLQARLSQ